MSRKHRKNIERNNLKSKPPKNVLKIITTSALIATLSGGVAFGTSWIVKNWDNLERSFNGANLYTQDDLDKARADGKTEALAEKEALATQVDELKVSYEHLTRAKAESDAKITRLEAQIEYNNELSDAQIEDLQNQLSAEKEINNNLDNQISTLQSQLEEANKKISAYEQIIQQYENDATAPVSYYDGDTLIKALLVDKGSTYQLSDELLPADTEDRQFVGFAVDGEIVEHNEYVVNTTTVFNAVFDYRITTIVNGDSTSAFIRQNTVINTHISDATPGANQEFSHWIDDDGNIVDTSMAITGAITLTAVFDEVYNITFNYNDKSETIRLVNGELESAIPVPTVATDYRQYGWRDSNNNYISDVTTLLSDTTLTPNIIQLKKIKIKYRTSSSGAYTEYNKYCYAEVSLDSSGNVSTYVVLGGLQFEKIIDEIELLTGKFALSKCYSYDENTPPYVSNIGPIRETSVSDFYVYLTLQ